MLATLTLAAHYYGAEPTIAELDAPEPHVMPMCHGCHYLRSGYY
jgi:hypothetical protein